MYFELVWVNPEPKGTVTKLKQLASGASSRLLRIFLTKPKGTLSLEIVWVNPKPKLTSAASSRPLWFFLSWRSNTIENTSGWFWALDYSATRNPPFSIASILGGNSRNQLQPSKGDVEENCLFWPKSLTRYCAIQSPWWHSLDNATKRRQVRIARC